MPRNWQQEKVEQHASGITDDITNAPPTFQEQCNNLVNDHRTHNLASRFGSALLRDTNGDIQDFSYYDGRKIDQIFQLEDDLVFNDWDESNSNGRLTIYDLRDPDSGFSDVITPTSAKGYEAYNSFPDEEDRSIEVIDENELGITGTIHGDSMSGYIDHITFEVQIIEDSGTEAITVTNYLYGFQVCHVLFELFETTPLDSLPWDYSDLVTDINAEGHNVSLYGSDGAINLSGGFARTTWADLSVGNTLTNIAFYSQGHLQPNIYQGEAYLAFEPYDKSITVNASDKNMLDPENFPPTSNRKTIKRISRFWDGTDESIEIRDAQLPTAYLETSNKILTPDDDWSVLDSTYKFQKYTLFLRKLTEETSGVYDIEIDMYFERGFGIPNSPTIVTEEPRRYLKWRWSDALTGQPDVLYVYDARDWDEDLNNVATALGATYKPDAGGLLFVWDTGSGSSYEDLRLVETCDNLLGMIESALNTYFTRSYGYFSGIGFHIGQGSKFSQGTFVYTVLDIEVAEVPTWYSVLPDGIGNFFYSYAYYLKNTYTKIDDGVPKLVEDYGPAALKTIATLSPINNDSLLLPWWSSSSDVPLTDLPTNTYEIPKSITIYGSVSKRFTRTTEEFFDFNAVTGVLARTENTGSVYYEVSENNWFKPIAITNTEIDPSDFSAENYGYYSTLTDKLADVGLIYNVQSYFNGGIAFYDPLPQGSFFMTIINGTGYYAQIINNSNRVNQSSPGIPSSAPRTFFSDFEDPITALEQFSDKPIVFTENQTWRMEGVRDATGVGRVFQRLVSDEYGCISNQSVIKTNIGLFYWSKSGIIFTDGLKSIRVTDHLLDRYDGWKNTVMPNSLVIGPEEIRGTYDEFNRRIFWSTLDTNSQPIWVMLDLYYSVSKSMPVFTANGPTVYSTDDVARNLFEARVIWFSEDSSLLYRGQNGYDDSGDLIGSCVLQHGSAYTNDETYETISDSEFLSPVDPFYKSTAMSFGAKGYRKWVNRVMINMVDKTNTGVSLQPLGWNDLNTVAHKLGRCVNYQHLVFFEGNSTGTLAQFFQHTDVSWRGQHLISFKRRFPRGRIRNVYKQFGFEQLPLELATLNSSSTNITDITVTRIAEAVVPQIIVTFTVTDPTNAWSDLNAKSNGSFYVKINNEDYWYLVQQVIDSENILLHGLDVISGSDYIQEDVTLTVARVPLDQKIELEDYVLTYTVIGDRTHGLPKPSSLGGGYIAGED
jgi:hypothetical protein